jgi:hypothetical protein
MAKKGGEVVFAVRVDGYLSHHNQFVVAFTAICERLEDRRRILLVSARPMSPRACHTPRRFAQTLAIGVFAEGAQQPLPITDPEF